MHGVTAAAFALVCLRSAFGVNLSLLAVEAQHPNFLPSEYTTAANFFTAVSIAIGGCQARLLGAADLITTHTVTVGGNILPISAPYTRVVL